MCLRRVQEITLSKRRFVEEEVGGREALVAADDVSVMPPPTTENGIVLTEKSESRIDTVHFLFSSLVH